MPLVFTSPTAPTAAPQAVPFPTEEVTVDGVDFPAAAKSKYSSQQTERIAYAAALAEANLKPADGIDVGAVYSNNKDAITNGQETSIRDNISALEKERAINGQRGLFNSAVETGDAVNAQAAVDAARATPLHKDSIEFNALDSFRADKGEANTELLDNTQAILASSMLANQDRDRMALAVDRVGEFSLFAVKGYKALQQSAKDHGNTLTTDILQGLVNGYPRLMEGVADNINTLLPKSYWKLLDSANPEDLRESVMTHVKENTLLPYDTTGTAGKAAADVSAFALGMAVAMRPLMSLTSGVSAGGATAIGLDGLRLTAAGTLADVAVFQGMDSAVSALTEAFPSTQNAITNWLGDRREDSPWENKARQAIEATALNGAFETVFAGLRIVKALSSAKAANVPMERAADNALTTSTLIGNTDIPANIASKKITGSAELDPIVDKVVTTDHVLEAASPSVMKTPLDVKPEIGIAGKVTAVSNEALTLKRMEQLRNTVYNVERLSKGELEAAQETFKESIEGHYANNVVTDVSYGQENGVNIAKVVLGDVRGRGYSSEQIARNQTEGLNVDIIQTPSGEFYPVHKRVIKESGFTSAIDFANTSSWMKNSLGRKFLDYAKYLDDKLLEDVGLAVNTRTQVKNQFVKPLLDKYFKEVSKDEFELVNTVAALGRDAVIDKSGQTGKWFNRDEFDVHFGNEVQTREITGLSNSDKSWESYKAYRELNDLHFAVENQLELTRKSVMGYEEISINLPDFDFKGNGVVQKTLDATDNYRVYSASENKMLDKGELRKSGRIDDYKDHKVIQLEDTTKIDTGEEIKYALVRPDDFKANLLNPIQVSYRSGGRVIYAGQNPYFLKQAITAVDGVGNKINLNPATHYTSETRQSLVVKGAALENARNAYKAINEIDESGDRLFYKPVKGINKDGTFNYGELKMLEKADADVIISRTTLVDSDNMKRLVDEGSFNTEHAFEVRGDAELPLAYKTGNTSYIDENHSGTSTWLASNKRKRFSARGERLLDPDEKYAKVLDPHQSMERSLNSIINSGLAGDYTTRISNQFSQTAKDMGFLKPEFANASPQRIFSAGLDAIQPSITGIADSDYQALVSTLKAIQEGLGFKTFSSQMKDAQLNKLAEYLENSTGGIQSPTKIRSKLSKTVATLNDKDPLQVVNNFHYYTTFGFNAAQFVVQGFGGATLVAAQSPLKATQALAGVWLHSAAFLRDDIPLAMSRNPKILKLLGHEDGKDMLDYIARLKKSGYINTFNTHIDLAKRKVNTGKHGLAFDLIDGAISKSTLAMETGEMMNQLITYRVADMRYSEQFPKISKDTPAAQGWIAREADKLGVDMKSAVQRSAARDPVGAIILRFKNFPLKVLEATTLDSKRTAKEKAAFLAAMAGAWGLNTDTTEYFREKFSIEDPKIIEGLENGVLNYLTSDENGDEAVDISTSLSPLGSVSQLFQFFDDDAKLSLLQGSLGDKLRKTTDKGWNSLLFINQLKTADPSLRAKLSLEALNELGKISTGWSNGTRGYHAFQTGILTSAKGQVISDDVTNVEAIATMFGLKTRKELKNYANITPLKDQDKFILETSKSAVYLVNLADQVDRATPEGVRYFNELNTMADAIVNNNPYSSEVYKKVNGLYKYNNRTSLEASTDKLDERRDNRIQFNKERAANE